MTYYVNSGEGLVLSRTRTVIIPLVICIHETLKLDSLNSPETRQVDGLGARVPVRVRNRPRAQDLITETHSTVERGRGRQRARKSESRYNDRPKEGEGGGVEAAIEKFTV